MPPFLETAVEIAREAGGLLANYFDRRVAYELKGEFDLVTEADRASEALIVERLRAHFPSHGIVAEEGGGHEGTSDYCWYVDPLDGTTNFAHGYPVYNVSIGLERSGEPVAGAVYDPSRGEMFAAEAGAGAYLNHRRIRVSGCRTLETSLAATGFPNYLRTKSANIHFYYQMALASHGVRRGGAAAIDLAYVACGRLEAFWEFGLKPWDMAAGVLLVREAGGTVTDMDGQPFVLAGPHILADNGHTHAQILELFGEIFSGRNRYRMPMVSPAGE